MDAILKGFREGTRSTASKTPQEIPPENGSTGFIGFTVTAFSHIGDRKTQEDRYLVCPELKHSGSSSRKSAVFGVFDGTVGDFASQNAAELMVPKLLEQQEWSDLGAHNDSRCEQDQNLRAAMTRAYLATDQEILKRCSANGEHYATSTSVTVAIVGDIIAVSHLGDSRVIITNEVQDEVDGVAITIDHEPHLPGERARIELNGGTVERLQKHGNKPYIRGGDFMMRKTLGEQPMQLQYSRAFGGKDLKVFGLTAEPEVQTFQRRPGTKHIILGSDGIWGSVSAGEAGRIAKQAELNNISPAEAIVKLALHNQAEKKTRSDNVTVVCVSLH